MKFDLETFLALKLYETRTGASKPAWMLAAAQSVVYPIVHLLFPLDEVFHPSIKSIPVERPIFVIGCPRSGTTLLFHLLAADPRVATYNLYRMLFPSVLFRRAIPNAVRDRFIRGFEAWFTVLERIHPIHAEAPEEDEILFLLLGNSGINTYVFPYGAVASRYKLNRFWEWPREKRAGHLRFYHQALQRLLFDLGRTRYVGKSPHFLGKVNDLLRQYPDALFVYAVRSPYECIPSALSFITTFWKIAFPETPPDGAVRQLYDDLVALWCHGDECLADVDSANTIIVPYDRLIREPSAIVKQIYARAELTMTVDYEHRLALANAQQRNWRSQHKYSLAAFRLTREDLRKDLSRIFSEHQFLA
ncbi:MAG TPA: sulfotransferase [Terriglobales bacterium]|nr:sulfotransferase [Terriglobales bacterium]